MTIRHPLFDEMNHLVRELDDLFNRALDEPRAPIGWVARRPLLGWARTGSDLVPRTEAWTPTFRPAVECLQRENEIVLRAELPGVEPEKIELDITQDRLTIRGEKQTRKEVQETDYVMKEFGYGRFERSFTLPESAKSDAVKAAFANGVLEITIPLEGAKPAKKIPIDVKPSDQEKKPIKAA